VGTGSHHTIDGERGGMKDPESQRCGSVLWDYKKKDEKGEIS